MADVMNIAVSLNKKVFFPAYVTLTSAFENWEGGCIHAYILHSELERDQIEAFQQLAEKYGGQSIECKVNGEDFAGYRTTQDWSVETYYRLFLTDFLPEDMERILYVDTDVIINQNIREYYEQDFEGNCFVVSRDLSMKKPALDSGWHVARILREEGYPYFNAGVMLYNLELLREMDLPRKFVEVEKEFHDLLYALDQDVLNYMFYGKVKFVDEYLYNFHAKGYASEEWNYSRVKGEVKIIHYSGSEKPWNVQAYHCDVEYIWWEYAKLTSFYLEIADTYMKNAILESDFREYILYLRVKASRLGKELEEKRQEYFQMRREVRRLQKELDSRK